MNNINKFTILDWLLITSLSLFLLFGCSTYKKQNNAPFISLDPIKKQNEKTVAHIEKAEKINELLNNTDLKIELKLAKESASSLNEQLINLQKLANEQTEQLNKSIKIYNDVIDEFNNLKIAHSKVQGAIWKRNFIILGLVGIISLFVALFVFKQWLRNNPATGAITRFLIG